MTTLAERLRGVIRPGTGGPEGPPLRHAVVSDDRRGAPSRAPAHDEVAEVLGGAWRDVNGHRYLVVDRTFAPGYRHGHMVLMDSLPPWPQLHLLGGPVGRPRVSPPHGDEAAAPRLVFVDLETTGLAGGAGTYAFLVGLAWFDSPSASVGQSAGVFRTRQYFLSSYTAERALLEGMAHDAASADAVVSYNGKSFDLPLIETRCLLHRMQMPFAALPHVDMLHHARRLWRGDEDAGEQAGCRLTMLEETLCGHRREGDVPGFEIPSRYFHYVRTGDARPLAAVLEHNRLDLLALALVTARAARLLDDGPSGARTAREALGLGRLYERAGRTGEACACYARGADLKVGPLPGDVATRAEALRAYALLARRSRRYADAAGAWRRVLELSASAEATAGPRRSAERGGGRRCPPAIAREATEALAVHHEHRARDLEEARRFAVQSLQFNISRSRQEAVQHRLARLNRKMGEPIAPLF